MIDLSRLSSPILAFDTAYYAGGHQPSARVEFSVDNGRSWTTIWHRTSTNSVGHVQVPLPGAAGHANTRVRLAYAGSSSGFWWTVDNIFVGTPRCVPQPGGLVAGVVTDNSSGAPVNGAQINATPSPQPLPWPEGISLATTDPALPGAFTGCSPQLAASSSPPPLLATPPPLPR